MNQLYLRLAEIFFVAANDQDLIPEAAGKRFAEVYASYKQEIERDWYPIQHKGNLMRVDPDVFTDSSIYERVEPPEGLQAQILLQRVRVINIVREKDTGQLRHLIVWQGDYRFAEEVPGFLGIVYER
jgi:hypothetical protein